jgi:hypothetical protein
MCSSPYFYLLQLQRRSMYVIPIKTLDGERKPELRAATQKRKLCMSTELIGDQQK